MCSFWPTLYVYFLWELRYVVYDRPSRNGFIYVQLRMYLHLYR